MVKTGRKSDEKTTKVRKRDRWTRAFNKRRRPNTPAPKTGWVLAELAQLTELPESTIRYYLNRRLIRPSEFRGTITRYQRRELMRLVAILRWKTEGELTLAEITRRLNAMTEGELESWLRSGPIPAAASTALGITGTALSIQSPSAPLSVPSSTLATASRSAPGRSSLEQWQRIALLPGLDLMLRSDANEAARVVAQRIVEEYASMS